MDRNARVGTATAPAAPPRHWKLSADQYQRMGEVGVLGEDDRVELLEGELYEMAPIGDWHNSGVDSLTTGFAGEASRQQAIVRVQGSFRLSSGSEPQPDILVLRFRPDFYRTSPVGPEDVLLVVEVADSSLDFDRSVKLPLYAQAGIPEVWIVNRKDDRFEVYRDPQDGRYRSVTVAGRGDRLSPLALPDLSIEVSQVLG